MIPVAKSRLNKKRKSAPTEDGKPEENNPENSSEQEPVKEGNFTNEYEYFTNTATEPSTSQINFSSLSDSDIESHCHIGTTADLDTDMNISNDNTRSDKMDRVELSTENVVETSRTGRPPIALYLTCDDDAMSPYQCFVRKQIELFEADCEDVESNAQGRNKPIVLGQVGIRCRFCNMLPPNQRKRGATYYPSKLDGIYQAANNLAIVHLGEHCQNIDEQLRCHLATLRSMLSIGGGGKKIWAERAAALGVFEDLNGLRFEPTINYRQRNYLDI